MANNFYEGITKGPWRAVEAHGTWFVQSQYCRHPNSFHGVDWGDVAYPCASNGCTSEDAHLIAAAPDLLEALEQLLSDITDDCSIMNNTIPACRAAIAKAKGDIN